MKNFENTFQGSKNQGKGQSGFALITFLMLFGLSVVLIGFMTNATKNNLLMEQVVSKNVASYYEIEKQINGVNEWLQANQDALAALFEDVTFADKIAIVNDYTVDTEASNQVDNFIVPSNLRIKSAGVITANYPILSNNSALAEASFPLLDDGLGGSIDLAASFASSFPSYSNGGLDTVVYLLNVQDSEDGKVPFFRVDTFSSASNQDGFNYSGLIKGKYRTAIAQASATPNSASQTYGFYGHDSLSLSETAVCKSQQYLWDSGNSEWGTELIKNNCLLYSNGDIALNDSVRVLGAALTNSPGGVTNETKIISENDNGCEALNCHNAVLNTYDNDWSETSSICTSYANLTITEDTVLNGNHDDRLLAPECYDTISVESGSTLTFAYDSGDLSNAFYIKTLIITENSSINIEIGSGFSNPEQESVQLYVRNLNASQINGNLIDNDQFAPHQLQIIYTGTSALTISGAADIRAHLYAYNAAVNLQGQFKYSGGINARSLNVSDSVILLSDEYEHQFDVAARSSTTSRTAADLEFTIDKINLKL